MPKKSVSYELALVRRDAEAPAYLWLYQAIRNEILSGRLSPGRRLPPTRDLARQYALSRGTIVTAFDQLGSEGYVEGSVGSGTYVSKALPENLLQIFPPRASGTAVARTDGRKKAERNRKSRPSGASKTRSFSLSSYGQRAQLFENYEQRPPRAFRANLPALNLFPMELWARLTARRLRHVSVLNLMGGSALGHAPLRQAIADYLRRSRGVSCKPEQVVMVAGVQEALDLTARLFLDPGDLVCMEDPGYPGSVRTFHALKAKVIPVPIDDEGIIISRLPPRGVRLIYITPGHQFPLGMTMSLSRRLALLEWARRAGALIFEDDYDSEFRYSGRPIPALQGLDQHSSVLYAGSFSKVMFPALRLGYLVVPSQLLARFEAALSLTVRHTPLLEQLVLCDFISDGHFERHLRRMREIYAARRSVLLEESQVHLAGLLSISGVEAGLQTVAWLSGTMSAKSAAASAARHKVDVTPIACYCLTAKLPQALQLGFASIDEKEIRRGVRELALALKA